LIPNPPALVESKNMNLSELGLWNSSIRLSLSSELVEPIIFILFLN